MKIDAGQSPAPTKLDIMEARAKQNHPYTRQKDGEVHVSLDGSNWWVYYGKNAMSPEDNPTAGQQESDELDDRIIDIIANGIKFTHIFYKIRIGQQVHMGSDDFAEVKDYLAQSRDIINEYAERLATRRAVEELRALQPNIRVDGEYVVDGSDIDAAIAILTATLTEGDAK